MSTREPALPLNVAGLDSYLCDQGVAARAALGNASSAHAEEAGRRAQPMAEAAWAQALRASEGLA